MTPRRPCQSSASMSRPSKCPLDVCLSSLVKLNWMPLCAIVTGRLGSPSRYHTPCSELKEREGMVLGGRGVPAFGRFVQAGLSGTHLARRGRHALRGLAQQHQDVMALFGA